VNLYIVNPILSIIKAIKNFLKSGEPIKLGIVTSDELQELAASIINLTAMIRSPK
jgi:hypothetical protein